jgi:hypothetical protein
VDNIKHSEGSKQALSVAQKLGLTLTSGHRSPSEDLAVGGTGSTAHTRGQAYDFAGSVSAMDKFADWAKNSGLFNLVLWRTKDHYDHVHVAWAGGSHNGHSHDVESPSNNLGTGSTLMYGLIRSLVLIVLFIVMITFFLKAFPTM